VNQNAIATFQVRRVLFELERERLRFRNNPRAANGAEILYAKFQAAIVEQIRDVLVCTPSFAFDEARKAAKIPQLLGFPPVFARCRPVAEDIRAILAALPGP